MQRLRAAWWLPSGHRMRYLVRVPPGGSRRATGRATWCACCPGVGERLAPPLVGSSDASIGAACCWACSAGLACRLCLPVTPPARCGRPLLPHAVAPGGAAGARAARVHRRCRECRPAALRLGSQRAGAAGELYALPIRSSWQALFPVTQGVTQVQRCLLPAHKQSQATRCLLPACPLHTLVVLLCPCLACPPAGRARARAAAADGGAGEVGVSRSAPPLSCCRLHRRWLVQAGDGPRRRTGAWPRVCSLLCLL